MAAPKSEDVQLRRVAVSKWSLEGKGERESKDEPKWDRASSSSSAGYLIRVAGLAEALVTQGKPEV